MRNFDDLISKVKGLDNKRRVAVVAAQDPHTLEAVFKAEADNVITPILIGDRELIYKALKEIKHTIDDDKIIDAKHEREAADKAVELINKGEADFIMKGKIQTGDLLKSVVDKEKGLRTGNVMTHFVINEVPSYHKMLVTMDGGMVTYPSLEEKEQILRAGVDTLKRLGYNQPKVAVLAAVEKVNPKMPETVDASKLKEMFAENNDCVVEGPVSYDLAMSKESAEIKGFNSPIVGDVDMLLVPNIVVGNILGKSLVYSAGARMAGCIVGAKAPIILTSRASSAEEKYLSIALAAAVS